MDEGQKELLQRFLKDHPHNLVAICVKALLGENERLQQKITIMSDELKDSRKYLEDYNFGSTREGMTYIQTLEADKAAALEDLQRVAGTLQWGDAENAIERADIILRNAISRLKGASAIETNE